MTIPVTVIIVTKNEAARIGSCIAALQGFDEIIVVDSASTDGTTELAAQFDAHVVSFIWNSAYPKKRQWCLDTLRLSHDWVLFIDADEIVTPALRDEIQSLFTAGPTCRGYFIAGHYVMHGRVLRHGIVNRKIALFDKNALRFPDVDDAGLPGMGEIEGHYQPVFKAGVTGRIGRLKQPLLHYAYGSPDEWLTRHRRYALWEAGMNALDAWPADPVQARQCAKRLFRHMPCRALAAFLHSYIFRGGFLDGLDGLRLARDRARYYRMIEEAKHGVAR